MTLRIRFNRAASRDLANIADFTEGEWGKTQAGIYVDQLITAIDKLADTPHIGSPTLHVRKDYRKLNVGSHAVFYRAGSGIVEIIRILHQHMNIAGKL